jgi:hypothetical protein
MAALSIVAFVSFERKNPVLYPESIGGAETGVIPF